MPINTRAAAILVTALFASTLHAQTKDPLPLKYVGPATKPAILAGDLMTRLYAYADDSMMGRSVGTEANARATAYIEAELRRLGLKPGGENGGYFQTLPVRARALDTMSTITVNGATFKAGVDFVATAAGTVRQLKDAQVIYGGTAADTANLLSADAVRGKMVLIRPAVFPAGTNIQGLIQSDAYKTYAANMALSAGGIVIGGDQLSPAAIRNATTPTGITMGSTVETAPTITVTTRLADALLGMPVATAPKGTVGKTVSTDVRFSDLPRSARNVVAILPGSDPKLAGQYIAIGAHNDHVAPSPRAVEHDSLRIYNQYGRPAGAEGGRNLQSSPISAAEWAMINASIDSLRKIYPARIDSINNGADDDGSGSVAVLELAEAFAKGNVKPKRSIIFVWHTGEERGMWGSGYFMDHPTVPRDSIVAQLNIDMIGRGAANDVTGQDMNGGNLHGAERYVQLVGSRRLSTELGDLVETVNKDKKYGFTLDYNIDANGHPQNIYCRSDHWSYAKWGVPVVFFTTGGHADYHQLTDEPQYIRYDNMAAVTSLIFDIGLRAANLDHRIVVDKPKPDPAPATQCKQ